MYNQTLFILKTILAAATITIFCFFSCEKVNPKPWKAEAVLTGTSTDNPVSGKIRFTQDNNHTVIMELDILVPKKANSSVAVHLHEHGMCGNGGADAHGHWNPTGKAHGEWGSASFHAGDIGNIMLDASGKGKLVRTTNLWTIGGSDSTNILNKGVIVHSGVDDYCTQPAGNSGPRIGCGVIQQIQ